MNLGRFIGNAMPIYVHAYMTLRLAQAHIYACISTIVLLVGIVSTDEIYLLVFRRN